MTYKEAVEKIVQNWGKYEHEVKGGHEAVWVAKSDIADSYEVDEEWIGIKGDGTFVWAYASGCSCWDEEYETKNEKEVKAFVLNHKWSHEDWEKAIVKFAEEGKFQEFKSYLRYGN